MTNPPFDKQVERIFPYGITVRVTRKFTVELLVKRSETLGADESPYLPICSSVFSRLL